MIQSIPKTIKKRRPGGINEGLSTFSSGAVQLPRMCMDDAGQ